MTSWSFESGVLERGRGAIMNKTYNQWDKLAKAVDGLTENELATILMEKKKMQKEIGALYIVQRNHSPYYKTLYHHNDLKLIL